MSETAPTLTCNRADNNEYTGTIGLPVPSTEISIRDDDGREVPLGQPGEICARGPQVMAGYWQRPDETAKVMTARRLLQDRRHRRDGCRRSGQDRRPQEGHGPRLRLQRLSQRESRTWWRAIQACSSARWSGCPMRQAARRVVLFVARKDPALTEQALMKFCSRAAYGLQEAQIHRLPAGAAEDQRRQGPAPGAARGRR